MNALSSMAAFASSMKRRQFMPTSRSMSASWLVATSNATAVKSLPTMAAGLTNLPSVVLASRVMRSCESAVRHCSLYSRGSKEFCILDISKIYSSHVYTLQVPYNYLNAYNVMVVYLKERIEVIEWCHEVPGEAPQSVRMGS